MICEIVNFINFNKDLLASMNDVISIFCSRSRFAISVESKNNCANIDSSKFIAVPSTRRVVRSER